MVTLKEQQSNWKAHMEYVAVRRSLPHGKTMSDERKQLLCNEYRRLGSKNQVAKKYKTCPKSITKALEWEKQLCNT